jgi:hypothetical protein
MNLRNVMQLPAEQDLKVLNEKFRVAAMKHAMGGHHIQVLIAKSTLKGEQDRLTGLQIERDWLLVKGELDGQWVQCARSHECYSEDPVSDGWMERFLLGQPYWLCSLECSQAWWSAQSAKMKLTSKKTEVTFESGKKAVLITPGKTLGGLRGAGVEGI